MHEQQPVFRARLGFTAIEISAVATIIALMALILIPIVRNRVEDSKIVAAQDDMLAIEKAEEMAHGFTGHYFRLQDLNHPKPEAVTDAALRAREMLKLPLAYWDRPVNYTELSGLADTWRGPFLSMQKGRYQTVAELMGAFSIYPEFFQVTPIRGIIPVYADATATGNGRRDADDWVAPDGNALARANYPIDPWGNPYLFFGSDTESDFGRVYFTKSIVVSLGPNGVPGNKTVNRTADDYKRNPAGPLGTGDDIIRQFD